MAEALSPKNSTTSSFVDASKSEQIVLRISLPDNISQFVQYTVDSGTVIETILSSLLKFKCIFLSCFLYYVVDDFIDVEDFFITSSPNESAPQIPNNTKITSESPTVLYIFHKCLLIDPNADIQPLVSDTCPHIVHSIKSLTIASESSEWSKPFDNYMNKLKSNKPVSIHLTPKVEQGHRNANYVVTLSSVFHFILFCYLNRLMVSFGELA